ncbi:MAG: RluA family pseudouridine synthase, partial [Phaeodactylibacter sp.]|nr:RluA family pseudouridine synthase [Phaeodactylibacter sp.]
MQEPALDILFEDEHFILVNKESGLLSIPDRYNADRPNLLHALQAVRPEAEILTVHRLDRETSGAICFAKHAEAHRLLSRLFENREVRKIYRALVLGKLPLDEGSIEEPIAPSEQKGRMIVAPWGKPSVTFFKVLERFKQHTLVAVNLATGRTHQIRVHF